MNECPSSLRQKPPSSEISSSETKKDLCQLREELSASDPAELIALGEKINIPISDKVLRAYYFRYGPIMTEVLLGNDPKFEYIRALAYIKDIDERIIAGLVVRESKGDNTMVSYKDAEWLFQLTPKVRDDMIFTNPRWYTRYKKWFENMGDAIFNRLSTNLVPKAAIKLLQELENPKLSESKYISNIKELWEFRTNPFINATFGIIFYKAILTDSEASLRREDWIEGITKILLQKVSKLSEGDITIINKLRRADRLGPITRIHLERALKTPEKIAHIKSLERYNGKGIDAFLYALSIVA